VPDPLDVMMQEMVFNISSLLSAYYSCRRGKRNSFYALEFEHNYERNLYTLHNDLVSKKYTIGRSVCFVITYPTLREIFAANFRDRVVHHLLISHIEKDIDKTFIYNSLACRKEKGGILGIRRLRKDINKITNNKQTNAYYLKLDIQSFFYTIDKNILYELLSEKVARLNFSQKDKEDLLWLSKKIIFHNPCTNYIQKGSLDALKKLPKNKSLFTTPPDKGLPIGNLTSQFFANVYLNEVDQFIKRKLKVKYYLRYADDMLFLSRDMEELRDIEEEVRKFLHKKLKLKIKDNKTKYASVYSGIDYLGYIVTPDYILSRDRVVNNFKKKLHYFNKGFLINRRLCMEEVVPLHDPLTQEEIEDICASVNSTFGHLKWANSFSLRQNLYRKSFGILTKYLEPQGNLESFRPRKPSP